MIVWLVGNNVILIIWLVVLSNKFEGLRKRIDQLEKK